MPKRHIEADLLVVDALTILLVMVVLACPAPFLRIGLGLVFLLFSPGYVLLAVMFPAQKCLRMTVRIALSMALSVAAGVFLGLILNISPWGFTLNSLLLAMSLFILLASVPALYLRKRQSRENGASEKSPSFFTEVVQSVRAGSWKYRSLVIILLCVIIGGLGALGYVMTRPLPSRAYSEFYILGAGGKAEAYPLELRAGEEGRVIVGIINHENQKTGYRIQVIADGAQPYDLPGVTLYPGEKWQQDVGITLREAGSNRKVEFLLYKDGATLYETRYIRVSVSG